MSTKKVGNIRIVYSNRDEHTASLAADACERTFAVAAETWGLKPPKDCRVYVMTSWQSFIAHSTPLRWKMTLALTLPLWIPRIRRTWPYSAAWTQRYGSRIAIGIKPSRLIENADREIGAIMSVIEPDPDKNIMNVTCHELIHACSAHLILPMWLNEGIAIYGTERFSGKPVIRKDTLELVRDYTPKLGPPTYGELSRMKKEQIAYHDCRGYWLVRYLEETRPGFLTTILDRHRYEDEIEEKIAGELGIEQASLWKEIDGLITGYFLEKK